ncbi:phosphatidylglycerol lysyltransferase domain-containing protein [Desulfovibrio sp. JY]|nr:phosphatidylglycerol lysyltransferase domain-containing protein [Desulfovibrio sp. JY]
MREGFEEISLARREEYLDRLARCPEKVSDYSFGNLWGWAEEYGLSWRFGESHVWILQTKPYEVFWAPVGPWTDVDWSECPCLSQGLDFIRVPERLCAILHEAMPERVTNQEARDHYDYVYNVSDLVELKGNKFHKKKNLLNQFLRTYDYEYKPLTPDCVEETLEMQRQWFSWRDPEESGALLAENQAIMRVLQHWDRIPGLMGGAVRVDGEMIAYTVAEALTPDMLVIHFEKGKPGFKGVYQAISQMFLADAGAGYALVDREQDLGDEGLRKAKLSYNPSLFLKKCTVSVGPKA